MAVSRHPGRDSAERARVPVGAIKGAETGRNRGEAGISPGDEPRASPCKDSIGKALTSAMNCRFASTSKAAAAQTASNFFPSARSEDIGLPPRIGFQDGGHPFHRLNRLPLRDGVRIDQRHHVDALQRFHAQTARRNRSPASDRPRPTGGLSIRPRSRASTPGGRPPEGRPPGKSCCWNARVRPSVFKASENAARIVSSSRT